MYQPFEPELDWSSFSVAIPEADIPRMHEVLDPLAAQPERLEAMQRSLACAAQHLVYSSVTGGVLGDDGESSCIHTFLPSTLSLTYTCVRAK